MSKSALNTYTGLLERAAPAGGFVHPALALALGYVQVRLGELRGCTLHYGSGLYEVRFSTDYLRYDLYVDLARGDVPGCITEPVCA